MQIFADLVARPGAAPFVVGRLPAGAIRDHAHADQIAVALRWLLTPEARALEVVMMAGEPGRHRTIELYGPEELCAWVESLNEQGELEQYTWTALEVGDHLRR
jgi:hypothetical protein